MEKQEADPTRHFGGHLFVHVDRTDKEQEAKDRMFKNFEKRHLKAYLRGDRRFSFGRDAKGFPLWFNVKAEWR